VLAGGLEVELDAESEVSVFEAVDPKVVAEEDTLLDGVVLGLEFGLEEPRVVAGLVVVDVGVGVLGLFGFQIGTQTALQQSVRPHHRGRTASAGAYMTGLGISLVSKML
jgi:hypothetical protein